MNIIIFGVTGELYKQKLAPALWYLFSSEMFPQNTKIIGFGRKPLGNGGLKVFTEDAVTQKKQNLNKKKLEKFL